MAIDDTPRQETEAERLRRLQAQLAALRGEPAPTQPAPAQSSGPMWPRLRAALQGAAMVNALPYRLSEEERRRENEADLRQQERRAPMRRGYQQFVEEGGLDDLPFPVSSGINPDQFAAGARRSAAREADDAEEDLARARRVEAGEETGVTMDAGASAAAGFFQQALRLPGDALRVASNVEAAVRGGIPQDETGLYNAAEIYDLGLQAGAPVDRYRQQQGQFAQTLSEAAGSSVPYLLAGPAGTGGRAAMFAMGSTQGGSESLQDAVAHDATFAQAMVGTLFGMGIGLTEAIPLSRAMGRVERMFPGRFDWMQLLRDGGQEALEEALQEGGAQFLQNVNAAAVGGWDPDRDLMQGVPEGAGYGAILGGVIGGGVNVVGQNVNRVEDDTLVGSIVQDEAIYGAAWDALRATGASTADTINQLGDLAQSLDARREEAERRGLPIPDIALEDTVEPEAITQIDRLTTAAENGLYGAGRNEEEVTASTAIFRAQLTALAAKDPEAFNRRIADLNLSVVSGEPGQGEGELNQFAGVNARTAQTSELARAQVMESEERAPQDIWMTTGWMRGPDGKWRFEISDADASLDADTVALGFNRKEGQLPHVKLATLLNHENLFKAYPLLKGLNVSFVVDPKLTEKTSHAFYTAGDRRSGGPRIHVRAGNEDILRSILLHEVQHAVQHIEMFAPGGNGDFMLTENERAAQSALNDIVAVETANPDLFNDLFDALPHIENEKVRKALQSDPGILLTGHDLVTEIAEAAGFTLADNPHGKKLSAVREVQAAALAALSGPLKPVMDRVVQAYRQRGAYVGFDGRYFGSEAKHDLYRALYGEVEARNTQARERMSMYERLTNFPRRTEDLGTLKTPPIFLDPKRVYGGPSPLRAEGESDDRQADVGSERPGDGGGRDQSRGSAPLEGAPQVRGASGPDPRLVEVAEKYAAANGIDLRRQAEYAQVDEARAKRIAQAYDEMQHAPNDPAVKEAYDDLIEQTLAQYQALIEAGYRFWFMDPANDPYEGNPWNAMRDLRENQSMAVFPTEAGFGSGATDVDVSDNPLEARSGLMWPSGSPDGELKPVTYNDLFRAVHDAFGHGLEGAGFRAQGEENAWQAHVRLFTGPAVGAITSETRGQNSWLNYGPHGEQNRTAKVEDTVFADQKTGLMPEWTWTEGRVGDQGPVTLNQSAVPFMLDPLTFEGTGVGGRKKNVDFATAVTLAHNRRHRQVLDPSKPRHRTIIVKNMVDELRFQLEQERTGEGWYTEDIAKAIAETTRLFPQLKEGINRDLFLTVTALLSPQQKPRENWEMAVQAMEGYFRDGKIPVRREGDKQYGVSSDTALSLLNYLIDTMGLEGAMNWITRPRTGREMAEVRRDSGIFKEKALLGMYTPNEVNLSDVLPGIYMFGPKVGDFMQNSVGIDHNAVTVDLWMGRTYNRHVGRLLDTKDDTGVASQPRGRTERTTIKELVREAAAEIGLDPSAAQAALWFFEQRLWREHGIPKESQTFAEAAETAVRKRLNDAGAGRQLQPDAGSAAGAARQGGEARLDQENRASITLPSGGVFSGQEVVIRLGQASDASSFMHEAAHLFLEMYRELSLDSRVIKAEYDAIRKWLGADGNTLTREQHEKFAEGFEAYLASGRAPVEGLAGAFKAFKNWLGDIYRSLRGTGRLSLDDEGRQVMDRLFLSPQNERVLGRRRLRRMMTQPGARTRVATPASPDQSLEAVALRDLADDLKKALGVPVTEGRMRARGAEGEFNTRTHEIRLRLGEDFATLVHEAGHLLQARHPEAYNKLVARAGQEMLQLNAGVETTQGTEMAEAFAELVRIYVESPVYLKENAPRALAAFVTAFNEADPKMMRTLQELSRQYNAYMTQSSERAVSGHIARTGVRGGIGGVVDRLRKLREEIGERPGAMVADWIEAFYAGMFDATAPIYRVQRDLASMYEKNHGRNYAFTPSKDFARLARLSADGYQSGAVDILRGVAPYRSLTPEGPSLADALKLALGSRVMTNWSDPALQDFGAYLVSRRMVEEYARWERGELRRAPDLFSLQEHLQNIKDKEAANPTYREAADMVNEWGHRLLKKKLDAGFITQAQFDTFTTAREFYVPVLRDVRRGRGGIDSVTSADRKNKDNRVRQFRGSNRAVINPIESMIRDAFQTGMAIWRNDTIGALYDMAEATGAGSASILQEVPPKEIKARRQDAAETFRVAAERAGVDEQDAALVIAAMDEALDGQTMAIIYGWEDAKERGEQILYLWRDGERKMIRLHDDPRGRMLWNALVGLGRSRHHWLVEAVSLPTRILTSLITGHPVFPAVNWLRDQLATATLSPNGFTPFASGLAGGARMALDQQLKDEYRIAGGHMGGINTSIAERTRRTANIQDLRGGTALRELASWRGIAAAFDVTESSTRIENYRLYKKLAKKMGLGEWDAALHAAYHARDTMDYRRKGGSMLAYLLGRVVPFFNPALQGTDKAIRTILGGRTMHELPRILRPLFSGRPVNLSAAERTDLKAARNIWPWLATMGVFSALLTSAHYDDPDYWEVDDRMRATHWHLWKRPDGTWVRIPKPFELAVPANLVERYLMMQYADDPEQRARMFTDLQHTMLPPLEMPILNLAGELQTNQRFDNGRPIVPEHMEGLPPPLQYTENTSGIARWFGNLTGTSPMVIDHVLYSLGGSYAADYRIAEQALDPNAPAMGSDQLLIVRRFLDNPDVGSQSVSDFWERAGGRGSKLERAYAGYRTLVDGGETDRALAFFRDMNPLEQEYALIRTHAAGGMRVSPFGPGLMSDMARRSHPVTRAEAIMSVNSDMRTQIGENALRRPRSEDTVQLTREERHQAIDILRALNVWEADNALRQTGFAGRADRPQADYQLLMETLEAISPEVASIYRQRVMTAASAPLADPERAAEMWQRTRTQARELAEDTDRLRQFIEMRQMQNRMQER